MDPQTLAYYQGIADTANALNNLAYYGMASLPDAYGGYADP